MDTSKCLLGEFETVLIFLGSCESLHPGGRSPRLPAVPQQAAVPSLWSPDAEHRFQYPLQCKQQSLSFLYGALEGLMKQSLVELLVLGPGRPHVSGLCSLTEKKSLFPNV